jgi:glycosyltransferase involved in cell wall biosynthesis
VRALFTIAGLEPVFGGPSRSVPALAAALAQAGVRVELLTCEPLPGQRHPLLPPRELVTSYLLPHSCRSTRWWPRANAFTTVLRERCRGALDCVVHDHGLWLPTNHAAAWAAEALNVPRMVSPRGMLSTWALQHRGWKKRVAWFLYQKRDLQSADVLHATSADEAAAFRAAGLTQPIAVISNGIDLPEWKAASRKQKAEMGTRKTVLFLGRIHPIKGLLDLVKAWAPIEAQGGKQKAEIPWRVVIAGNDEDGHLAEVKAESRRRKLEMDFEFVGPVEGAARWELYRSADLFVLPSHSENFGLVVAEALACGVPVITTRGTPWEDLETSRCGWWIELGVGPLAEALGKAMALTDDERREMGERGRRLVESEHTWARVAEQMKSVYEWMLRGGEKPECVR